MQPFAGLQYGLLVVTSNTKTSTNFVTVIALRGTLHNREHRSVAAVSCHADVTPCGLVEYYCYFGETYCFHLQGQRIGQEVHSLLAVYSLGYFRL
jgi:hypothetical protein